MVARQKEEPQSSAAPHGPQKIFYGWVIVGCSFTVLSAAYGIQFSYGVFMLEVAAETGWGRTSLSLAYSLYVFIYAALSGLTGLYTDRWGPRIVLIAGSVLLGCGIMLLGHVQELWELYAYFGVLSALGMSATFVPCNATVARWFSERRGLALSLSTSGSSFGSFLVPPLAALLIDAHGWRDSYVILGFSALLIIAICAVFIRRDPEQIGQKPDGGPSECVSADSPAPSNPEDAWTLGSARRTGSFWVLVIAFTATWLVVFIPMLHIVPLAMDLDAPSTTAALLISVIGFFGLAGRLITGPLSDRYGPVLALGTCFGLQSLSFVGFSLSAGLPLLFASAALFGFCYGGTSTLFAAIVATFYGRLAVGAIVGFIFSIAGSAAAFGPLAAGYLHDQHGTYEAAFVISAVLNLFAASLMFFAKKPALPTASIGDHSRDATGGGCPLEGSTN